MLNRYIAILVVATFMSFACHVRDADERDWQKIVENDTDLNRSLYTQKAYHDVTAEALIHHAGSFPNCRHLDMIHDFFYARCKRDVSHCREYVQYYPQSQSKTEIEAYMWTECQTSAKNCQYLADAFPKSTHIAAEEMNRGQYGTEEPTWIEDGNSVPYQQALQYVENAQAKHHVRDLDGLVKLGKQIPLEKNAEEALVRVMNTLLATPERKPPVQGTYSKELLRVLLPMWKASERKTLAQPIAWADDAIERMDREVLAGQPTIGSMSMKTATLLSIARRRKLRTVSEIMAVPEARLLNPEEREVITANLEDELPEARRQWAEERKREERVKKLDEVQINYYAALLMMVATAKHIDNPDEIMKLPSASYIPPGLVLSVREKVVDELNREFVAR